MTHTTISKNKNEIHIHTDGSCLGNPGIGGWGAIIQYNDKEKILSGGDPSTTNNRMEMTGIISALEWCKKSFFGKLEKRERQPIIKIHSDSNLIIQTLLQHWKRKKNTDLWAEMDKVVNDLEMNDCKIEWIWVKGHAENIMNNRVDKVAVSESLKIKNRSR